MKNQKGSLPAAAGLAAVICLCAGDLLAQGALPSLDSGELAQGPYSDMHMLLQ